MRCEWKTENALKFYIGVPVTMNHLRLSKWIKTITTRNQESEMRELPACEIRRFMIAWRYENERESRWEDLQCIRGFRLQN